jgi:uncharacterized protein YidB (DUF937 family)
MASNRMLALLGLLAVAGYQNRDKLGEMLGRVTAGGAGNRAPGASGSDPMTNSQSGGLGDLLGGLFGGSLGGAGVTGGLGDLIQTIGGKGHRDVADSWVQRGPNRELDQSQLEEALGGDTLETLRQQTGLSREDLLSRLQQVLPIAVDKMTPEGRLPTEAEVGSWSQR